MSNRNGGVLNGMTQLELVEEFEYVAGFKECPCEKKLYGVLLRSGEPRRADDAVTARALCPVKCKECGKETELCLMQASSLASA